MKVVAVILTLVAASMADICNDVAGGRAQATPIKNGFAVDLDSLMGDCYPNGEAFSALLNSKACSALFYQETCYQLKTAAEYYYVDVVNYEMLRRRVSDLASLGNTMCGNVEACYNDAVDAVSKCLEDPDYLQEVLDRAADPGASNENTITIIGRLLKLATKQVMSTYHESETEFDESHVSFLDVITDFCDTGCVDKSARFFEMLFSGMQGGGCNNAIEFCGACENNARRFFKVRSEDHSIPCCLQSVIEQAIEHADYCGDSYSGEIGGARSFLMGSFADCREELHYADQPELTAEEEAAAAAAKEQFNCVASVYQASKSVCV